MRKNRWGEQSKRFYERMQWDVIQQLRKNARGGARWLVRLGRAKVRLGARDVDARHPEPLVTAAGA